MWAWALSEFNSVWTTIRRLDISNVGASIRQSPVWLLAVEVQGDTDVTVPTGEFLRALCLFLGEEKQTCALESPRAGKPQWTSVSRLAIAYTSAM